MTTSLVFRNVHCGFFCNAFIIFFCFIWLKKNNLLSKLFKICWFFDRILLVIFFLFASIKSFRFSYDYSLIYDNNFFFFFFFPSNKGKEKKISEEIMLTFFKPTKPSDPKYFDCFYKHLCFLHFNDDISNYFRITDFNDFK